MSYPQSSEVEFMKKVASIASIVAVGIMLQASAVSAHVPIPGIDFIRPIV